MLVDLILGTAGHIDHGKTSLIRALTGKDTDRLPEEKQRGITIEPGFAQLRIGAFNIGIVDVPGHERFIRQMLSGATGMDLVMLVIAADDSINQQTIEHLDILRLLHLRAGLVVITKCDLVQPEWLGLVEEEIRQFVAGTFLAEAPIVRTSAITGAGMEELKQAIERLAGNLESTDWEERRQAPFRMAIDRSFSATGHGAVLTGSVASGSARVGDTLVIEPGRQEVRVRSLQNHDLPAEAVFAGQRAAINVPGVEHPSVVRGQEIAAVGYLQPSKLLTVQLRQLRSAPRPLKDRARVRFHAGTAEILATVRGLDREHWDPGDEGLAQLFLSEPAVCTNQQPFVIRSESPVRTIGGGIVLDPTAHKLVHPQAATRGFLQDLAGPDRDRRLAASVYLQPLGAWSLQAAPRLASVYDAAARVANLVAAGELLEIALSPSIQGIVHPAALDELGESIERVIDRMHEGDPLKLGFLRSRIEQHFDYLPSRALFEAALARWIRQKRIDRRGELLAVSGRGPQLSKNQRKLLEELVTKLQTVGLETPEPKQMATRGADREAILALLRIAVDHGELHEVSTDYFLHQEVLERVQAQLQNALAASGFTVSQMRELLGTSRKYAVPLAEYLDKIGFTRREGDLRFIGTPGVASAVR